MDTLAPAQGDDGTNPSSVKSDDSPQHESGRSSPPPKCAICLGVCRNKSFTDSCLHQFCFKCLLTWSKVKAECPLCKQNFMSIIHNVQSNHEYEEYRVEQRQAEDITERIEIDNIAEGGRRFRFRTTLTLPRRESLAIQQLLLHYPLVSDVLPVPRRRSPASFRRTVYRYNLWARPLPDFTGRFRDCTPDFYRRSESQMHRLVPWLSRELNYLLNENAGHISYVISRILDMLPQHHINSTEFRDTMLRYFGDRTEHFLHELYCFASTPYDMTGYDRNVQYTTDTRISTMINEIISSSDSEASVDSDIVMISSSEPASAPPGPSRAPPPAPLSPQTTYFSQPPTENIIPIETISQSDTDDDSSEVMVVGYIKPPQDRTPEVVDLIGSDSDVIVQDTLPAEAPPTPPSREPEGGSSGIVKIQLKRVTRDDDTDSDSDDGGYTPPLPGRRSACSASSSDDSSYTPPRPRRHAVSASASASASTSTSASHTSSYDSCEDNSSTEPEPTSRVSSKKSRVRKISVVERKRRKKREQNRAERPIEKATISERKPPRSRKGSKAPRRAEPATETRSCSRSAQPLLDQPSTSGTSRSNKRKLDVNELNREKKRLKSVVNVINGLRNEDSSSSSKCNSSVRNSHRCTSVTDKRTARAPSRQVSADSDDTDSEDNLPLNLTITHSSM